LTYDYQLGRQFKKKSPVVLSLVTHEIVSLTFVFLGYIHVTMMYDYLVSAERRGASLFMYSVPSSASVAAGVVEERADEIAICTV
jgi:hypothetical protein